MDPTPDGDVRHRKRRPDTTGERGSSADSAASAEVNTSGSSWMPIPLVVLTGLSLALLVAVGGFGHVSGRRRAETGGSNDLR